MHPARVLVVAAAHFKAKPAFAKVRTQQMQYMLDIANSTACALASALPSCSVSTLAMGDFNGHPAEQPSLYSAGLQHPARLASAYAVAAGAPNVHCATDADVLRSGAAEPPFTTWKFRGSPGEQGEAKQLTIDYIMYTPRHVVGSQGSQDGAQSPGAHLTPLAVLALPTEADIGPAALPSATEPSDHLPLAARFAFFSNEEK